MRLLTAILFTIATLPAFAHISNAPFMLESDQRFDKLERGMLDLPGVRPVVDGNQAKQVARVTYDVAVSGGSIAAHTLGVQLPANAIITQAYYYTKTQFAGASGTVALSCGSATILTAAVQTAIVAGTITAGNETGTAANMASVGSTACSVTATVATTIQTAGKMVIFVEYVTAL